MASQDKQESQQHENHRVATAAKRDAVTEGGDAAGVILSQAAVAKIQELLLREGRNDLRLRVAVQPGGCSGLRYQLFFDDMLSDDDMVIRYGEVSQSVSNLDSLGASHGAGHDNGYEGRRDE